MPRKQHDFLVIIIAAVLPAAWAGTPPQEAELRHAFLAVELLNQDAAWQRFDRLLADDAEVPTKKKDR